MTISTRFLYLATGALATVSSIDAASAQSTVLVNFSGERQVLETEALVTDYSKQDPSIIQSAPVNVVYAGSKGVPVDGAELYGVSVSVSTGRGSAWVTEKGDFAGVPILDSYLFTGSDTALAEEVIIEGLAQIPAGKYITLTLWGSATLRIATLNFA